MQQVHLHSIALLVVALYAPSLASDAESSDADYAASSGADCIASVPSTVLVQSKVNHKHLGMGDHEALMAALGDASERHMWQSALVAGLQDVDAQLTKQDIPYWITGGSLVGAMRHKGIVPHDDDVDIELFSEDLPKAISAMAALGWSYCDKNDTWEDVPMGRFDLGFTSMDVFVRDKDDLQSQYYPSLVEIFPLQRAEFNGIHVNVPHLASTFLSRAYGESWASHAQIFDHGWDISQAPMISLSSYLHQVRAMGYEPPTASATAAESLQAVGLLAQGTKRYQVSASTSVCQKSGQGSSRAGSNDAQHHKKHPR